ncbi:hypothetical protein SUGI_1112740 [Cryptomeria japonica]|nr:hypothetical protein SUGI_1112740 [Cryptomeria japonica]
MRRPYEIMLCLLVDVMPSKETVVEKITSFLRECDAEAIGSAIMEVEEEALTVSILQIAFTIKEEETSLSPASGRSFNQLYCRRSFSQPSSLPLRDSSCITALVK